MAYYLTTGQVARQLRISVSTLKRWLLDLSQEIPEKRNYNGWRLFTDLDVEKLKEYKRIIRRKGKRFNDSTLIPTIRSRKNFRVIAEGNDM